MMTAQSDTAPVARHIASMARRNDHLRAIATEQHPGARDICNQQTGFLRDMAAELDIVRKGGSWYRLNDLMECAENTDGLVRDMIETIEHPERARKAWEWAERNLP